MSPSENLIEDIVRQKINIEFEYMHYENNAETKEKIVSDLRNLIEKYNQFRSEYPQEHHEFMKKNPKYDLPQYKFFGVLEVFANDTNQGFNDILDKITSDTTQTVINVVEHAQTNKCFQWLKRNNNQAIKEKAVNHQEKEMFLQLGALSLPKIKREEFGDLIGMSMAGILSENFDNIQAKKDDTTKVSFIRGLLAKNRKYINFDYPSQKVTDQTDIYGSDNEIYRPRSLMAQKLIDSSYLDANHNLFVTVCTNDEDVTKQGSQLFKTIKTLTDASARGELLIDGKNAKPVVTFFNQAFFCTEDEKSAVTPMPGGRHGGVIEKEGFHFGSNRADFDRLVESPMAKEEMDKINGLTTLSLLGNNLKYPDVPHTFEISDLIFANPVTAGSSTLWLYKEFLALQVYDEPKRSQKLFNYLLDYADEVTQSLMKIKPQTEDSNLLSNITKTHDKMISGIFTNFTSYNLKRDLSDSEREKIEKLMSRIEAYNQKNPKFSLADDTREKLEGVLGGGFERRGATQAKKLEQFNAIMEENQKFLNMQAEEKRIQKEIAHQKRIDDYEQELKDNERKKELADSLEKEKIIQKGLELQQRIQELAKYEIADKKITSEASKKYLSKGIKEAKDNQGMKDALIINDKQEFNQLKEKLSAIGSYVYNKNLPYAKSDLGSYLDSIIGTSHLMIRSDYTFATTSFYLSQKKKRDELLAEHLKDDIFKDFPVKSSIYSKFLMPSSPANKNFKENWIREKDDTQKEQLIQIKSRLDEFFNIFQSESGLKNMLHNGGLNKTLKNLIEGIEKDFTIPALAAKKKNI